MAKNKKEVICNCPICGEKMVITKMHCPNCDIEISGEFTLSKFSNLTKEQISFVETFLKNQGNIKAMEKDLNISYPTVKKMLQEVLVVLGYENVIEEEVPNKGRQEILDKLANKEISFGEAMERLKNI